MKIVEPSSSYSILVPDDIHEDYDDRVTSLWDDGDPMALQLSSYRRHEGQQIPAEERLEDEIKKISATWSKVEVELCSNEAVDQAAAKYFDGNAMWIHAFFVWPDLAIYVTLGGPPQKVRDPDSWARIALKNLSPATR